MIRTAFWFSFWAVSILPADFPSAMGGEATSPEALGIPQSATGAVSLGELIREAFENNPDIQSARARWAQAVERYPEETALEDPVLNFSYYIENVETRVGPQEFSAGIAQKFPFPGTLRQKGRVVEKDIRIAELRYEMAARDIIADLKESVYEIRYLDGAIGITRQNMTLLDEILADAQARYSDNRAALNDVFQAESQLAQLDYDLITLRELRSVRRAETNALLNRPADHPLPAVAAPAPADATSLALDKLDALALRRNQEIQIARTAAEKAEETTELTRRKNLPSFSLGLQYINTGDSSNPLMQDSGKDPVMIMGSVTVPVWIGKNRARVRHALEGENEAANDAQSAVNRIHADIRKVFFQLQNARRLILLYEKNLLPQARHSMQTAGELSRGGGNSLSGVLETQSVWLNFNLAWLRAKIDYAIAWTRLERLAGGSLGSGLLEEEEPE